MTKKRIALVTNNNRISPRFRFSEKIIIFDVSDNLKIINTKEINLYKIEPYAICHLLFDEKVNILICGGITEQNQLLLNQFKIKLVWGIIGDKDEVINKYLKSELEIDTNFCYRNCGLRNKNCFKGRRNRFRKGGL
jgi:predicted Fe-Mo cluster-binding NifX family protein